VDYPHEATALRFLPFGSVSVSHHWRWSEIWELEALVACCLFVLLYRCFIVLLSFSIFFLICDCYRLLCSWGYWWVYSSEVYALTISTNTMEDIHISWERDAYMILTLPCRHYPITIIYIYIYIYSKEEMASQPTKLFLKSQK
jgi:hypothetical protein